MIENGEFSDIVDFDSYMEKDQQKRKELWGLTTKDGITIKGHALHFIDRTFGTIYKKREEVELVDIRGALLSDNFENNQFKINSVKYSSNKCQVPVNPITSVLIQTNPKKWKGVL